jgi:flagellar protein FlaI
MGMAGYRGALREKIARSFRKQKTNYPKFFLREPRIFIDFPESKGTARLDVKYPLLEPLVYARILWDPVKRSIIYNIIEPLLSERENSLLEKIKADLTELIDVEISSIRNREQSITYMEEKVAGVLQDNGMSLTPDEYIKIMYFVIRDFVGFNEIDPLMHDPYIEDIGCDGLNVPIYIVHRRFGSVETSIIYKNSDYLENFVIKLSERCGRYVSYAKPLLDGSLPDGSRIQASLAKDVTTRGPTFSIRKFRANPISPVKLIEMKTASPEMMAYMWLAVQHSSSMLICGGVATGKTTFLNAITMFIPPEEKIVSIEDTRELNLPHENWIPSVSRSGFGAPDESGTRYGEVTLFDLLKESFRQNPDYVIVGEVRGQEASVMFQGMASGLP